MATTHCGIKRKQIFQHGFLYKKAKQNNKLTASDLK